MSTQRAFITGITGQDGSYLCELLLGKGYEVHGLVRRPEGLPTSNIRHLVADAKLLNQRLFLYPGTIEDTPYLRRIITQVQPHEFYHLAGQSSPRISLELPESTVSSTGLATLPLLEILRGLPEPTRFLYASSSEVFGSPKYSPQDEETPLSPINPYGAAKVFSQHLVRIYRIAHQLPACSAILYNHESPRRGDAFVTMKIARAVARIKRGLQQDLVLGGLEGRRDWGWAPDYVRAMWLILQQNTADDFVLATGEPHSVAELVAQAFECVGLKWLDYVRQDPALVATAEPVAPCGNPAKAKQLLSWENSVPFDEMVSRLVESELNKLV